MTNMEMHREGLRVYLHSKPLVQSIEYKAKLENISSKLRGVILILQDLNFNKEEIGEIQKHYNKYKGLCKDYADMLKSEWGVDQQQEKIILKYCSFSDSEIDGLPEYVSW